MDAWVRWMIELALRREGKRASLGPTRVAGWCAGCEIFIERWSDSACLEHCPSCGLFFSEWSGGSTVPMDATSARRLGMLGAWQQDNACPSVTEESAELLTLIDNAMRERCAGINLNAPEQRAECERRVSLLYSMYEEDFEALQ